MGNDRPTIRRPTQQTPKRSAKLGGIAQLARASALQAEGRRFESVYLHNIEIWCNGSTTDSGSVSEGSNPSISTKPKDLGPVGEQQ